MDNGYPSPFQTWEAISISEITHWPSTIGNPLGIKARRELIFIDNNHYQYITQGYMESIRKERE